MTDISRSSLVQEEYDEAPEEGSQKDKGEGEPATREQADAGDDASESDSSDEDPEVSGLLDKKEWQGETVRGLRQGPAVCWHVQPAVQPRYHVVRQEFQSLDSLGWNRIGSCRELSSTQMIWTRRLTRTVSRSPSSGQVSDVAQRYYCIV